MHLKNGVLSKRVNVFLLFSGKFTHISNYSLTLFLGVLEEAEFYNIASLVRLVKERIRDNENRTSQVMGFELLRGKCLRWLSLSIFLGVIWKGWCVAFREPCLFLLAGSRCGTLSICLADSTYSTRLVQNEEIEKKK